MQALMTPTFSEHRHVAPGGLFARFVEWRAADRQQPTTPPMSEASNPLTKLPQPRRGRGAPTDPDNDWARREVGLGRDRADVFQEYLQRRNVDPTDRRAVSQARERFKKALAPNRGRK